jgi:drug/metabolite transporter (DMT)-like permease
MNEMSMRSANRPPSTGLVVLAFLSVYLIWGSTYLTISIAIDTIPPLLMAGVRFLIAGGIFLIWSRSRGETGTQLIHWRSAFIIGLLMIFGGNGGVTFAEQYIPTGMAAVLVTMVALWMVVIEWLRPRGVFPGWQVVSGLALGFGGVIFLVGPANLSADSGVNPIGVVIIFFGSLGWASGSLYSREAPLPAAPLNAVGMEMLMGGLILATAGLLRGEGSDVALDNISTASVLALLYLAIFGSMIAFTAYIWLLKVTSPARVGTYVYVNPVIAMFLGWTLGDESLSAMTLIGSGMIIGAVILISTYRQLQKGISTADHSEEKAEPLLANEQTLLCEV